MKDFIVTQFPGGGAHNNATQGHRGKHSGQETEGIRGKYDPEFLLCFPQEGRNEAG